MLFFEYFFWHYSTALKNIIEIAHNYLVATWFRFGIVFHLKTLFYPWRRQVVVDEPSEGMIMNLLMKGVGKIADFYLRIVAAIVRCSVIITGLISSVLTILFFTIIMVIWLCWPFLFLVALSKGITLVVWN